MVDRIQYIGNKTSSAAQVKFFSSDPGSGWLACNGDAVSKTAYPGLVGILDEGMASRALPIATSVIAPFAFAGANDEIHLMYSRNAQMGTTPFSYSTDGVNFTSYAGPKSAIETWLTSNTGNPAHTIVSAFYVHDGTNHIWFIATNASNTGNLNYLVARATTIGGSWTVTNITGISDIAGTGYSNYGITSAGYASSISKYWILTKDGLYTSANLSSWSRASLWVNLVTTFKAFMTFDGTYFMVGNGVNSGFSYSTDLTTWSIAATGTYDFSNHVYTACKVGTRYQTFPTLSPSNGSWKSSTLGGTYTQSSVYCQPEDRGFTYISSPLYHKDIGVIMQYQEQGGTYNRSGLFLCVDPEVRTSYKPLYNAAAAGPFLGVFETVTVSPSYVVLSQQNENYGSCYGTGIFRRGLMLPDIQPIGDGRRAYIRVR